MSTNLNKTEKIELKIKMENFGPLSKGEINLKPLTIFIGPNNSGKSYTAMLIHSIFESYPLPERFPIRKRFFSQEFDFRILSKQLPELKEQIEKQITNLLKDEKEIDIPKQTTKKIIKKIFEEIYQRRLTEELTRSYACPLNELVRIGKKSFKLEINFNSSNVSLISQENKIKIKKYPKIDVKIKLKSSRSPHSLITVKINKNEILIELGGLPKLEELLEERKRKEFINFLNIMIPDMILNASVSYIFKNFPILCYYLPAARSGILQAHKALAATIVKRSPYAGIEKFEIPKLSGVVSDFISSILTLPEKEAPFYKLAQDFERELIKGEVVIRALDEYLGPEIKYNFMEAEIPLHRASSTVSELAPLFLYLKYYIEPNTILIIEEPEAHLHPQSQQILAKYLVKMIRKGVKIIITTHSEYLLRQISNFILLSKIKPEARIKRYRYKKDDFLKPDEVSVYVFKYDKNSKAYKTAEVEVSENEGISDEEFVKIHESLYEEEFKLQKEIG